MVVNNNARFCKYEIKNNKMENLVNDDFDSSSSDNETVIDSDNDNESGKDESNE